MVRFVRLTLLNGATVAINPEHVTQAVEFDSGRGVTTTLKLTTGDVHVKGTLDEVLQLLQAGA
jgi:hypothetical protein